MNYLRVNVLLKQKKFDEARSIYIKLREIAKLSSNLPTTYELSKLIDSIIAYENAYISLVSCKPTNR